MKKILNILEYIKVKSKNGINKILNYFGSIRQDLLLHQYVSYVIYIIFFALLYTSAPIDVAIVLSVFGTIGLGLFKEQVIDCYLRGGKANKDDVIHDLIGVGLGLLTSLLFLL